jgi:type II secretory pathway pseudopilin PulG
MSDEGTRELPMIGKNRKEQGFSLLETLIVIGVMFILAGITLIKSFGTMESYRANSAMDTVISQLRVARQLAISQRRSVQIAFNLGSTPQTISYQALARPGVAGDANGPLVKMPLPPQTQFVTESGVPDTPMAFGTCSGASAVCINNVSCCLPYMVYTATGQFAGDDLGTTIYNGTIFLGIPSQPNTARGVTIMGGTGRVRPYTFIGPQNGTPSLVWIE